MQEGRNNYAHAERLEALLERAYLAPHPSWKSRTPILVFPREIPSGPDGAVSDLCGEIEAGLERHFRSYRRVRGAGCARVRSSGSATDQAPGSRRPSP
jgi:hypothetical protein